MCRKSPERNGLTFLELVVVLAILAILAGLVISVMPSLIRRTHLAKCADTIAELNKTWMRAYAVSIRYPDVYDSLLDAGGGSLDARLPAGLTAQLLPHTLTPGDVAALAEIGITRVIDLQPTGTGGSVTYDAAPPGAPARVLAGGGSVAELNLPAHLAAGNALQLKRHLRRQADGSMVDNSANVRYVVFGLGSNCTAVGSGKLIQEAPVHFGASDAINPTNVYQRYLVVFSLTTLPDGSVAADFEAAAGNDVNGPSSSEGHIRQFHDATSAEG